jgi:hypothetical protein
MKKQRERPKDLLDLHELKMARTALSLPIEDPWTQCTFDGSQRANLRRLAALSFAEKLNWLADARQLAQSFQNARRKMGLKTLTIDGQLED